MVRRNRNLVVQRDRGSVALSEQGKAVVLEKYREKAWKQNQWAGFSATSVPTVRRFIAGDFVDAACFHALITALGLEVNDDFKIKRIKVVAPLLLPALEPVGLDDVRGIFMTARFTEDNYTQVARGIRHLTSLLINGVATYGDDKNSVTVSGDFSEDDREHIEMTIAQLEKLFSSHRVTW